MSDSDSELKDAIAQFAARRFAEAEALCRRILAREPNNAMVLHLCAGAVAHQRRLEESINLLGRATTADAKFFPAWDDLARVYDAARRPLDAAECLRHAAELRGDDASVLIRWSTALLHANRPAAAGSVANRALKLQPDAADALFNRACALEQQSRLDEAVEDYRRVLTLRPAWSIGYLNLGAALQQKGQIDEAEKMLAQAVRSDPQSALALSNWAMVLADLDRMHEAEPAARRAVELQPGNSTFAVNLATLLGRLHRTEEALAFAQRATQLDPNNHLAHTLLAMVLLTLGRWREAWPEWDWRTRGWDVQPTGRTPWDGSPLDGRSIVVRAEQGFGDTIQCLRFVPLLKSQRGAGKVMIECQRPLKDLLESVPGVDEVHFRQESAAPGATEAWIMSLPRWFDTTPQTIPQIVPYVFASPARVATLEPLVQSVAGGLKVGLVWAGSPTHVVDRQRSCPAGELSPLTRIEGVALFSLQRGPAQQRDAHLVAELGLIDLAQHFQDVSDLAAAMTLLDLIITVDTSAAHLAGAMARPVWTLLSTMPEWRYPREGERSPWYPTMQLFRQSRPGQWSDVIARVAEALRKVSRQHHQG